LEVPSLPPGWHLEVGPANASFELPQVALSGLRVRFVRLWGPPVPLPALQWVRYLTHSDSYVFRL
ncbi:AP4M1 protein, partial [Sakesphorus luctuosus]|nr:AP4M1 protein [Sakesphorus luctuosus]